MEKYLTKKDIEKEFPDLAEMMGDLRAAAMSTATLLAYMVSEMEEAENYWGAVPFKVGERTLEVSCRYVDGVTNVERLVHLADQRDALLEVAKLWLRYYAPGSSWRESGPEERELECSICQSYWDVEDEEQHDEDCPWPKTLEIVNELGEKT